MSRTARPASRVAVRFRWVFQLRFSFVCFVVSTNDVRRFVARQGRFVFSHAECWILFRAALYPSFVLLLHPTMCSQIHPNRWASARNCYPPQQPELFSGSAPAAAARNFCRQWSLQKKNIFPSRSAWRAVPSSTVMPQMGSLVSVVVRDICFTSLVKLRRTASSHHPAWLPYRGTSRARCRRCRHR